PKAGPEVLNADVAKPGPLDKVQLRALDDFSRALQHYRAGRVTDAMTAAKKEGVEKLFSMAPDKIDQKTFLGWCDSAKCKVCNTPTSRGVVRCPTCNGRKVFVDPFGGVDRCAECKGKGTIECRACEGHGVLDRPEEAVRVALRYELWALDQLSGGEDTAQKEAAAAKGWSAVLRSGRSGPVLR